ncbi:argininosuccinate synthase [Geoglobus acetivorans]|uniref:Argininosuccinate synthase n=1 Tax=Geoglobus acetivorans TaxID=565033 RepID=A0ABZ3H0S8_GEOAI|nr:argininosuccinate synthase [Geoglobus acetivorans]
MSKVVLCYSGGLDTTVCIPLLKERYGFAEVITVTVDVGQPESEVRRAEERGKRYADRHYTVDAKEEFVNAVFQLVKANGDYEGYVLGTALARPIIAEKVAEVAKKENADAVAHGATGKGNDQLRFDNIFLQHGFKVIAPMRELNLTREWEIEYANEHGIDIPVTKDKPWSIDENIWSRSIEGGKLEDPSYVPPDEIYEWTKGGKTEEEIITIEFEKGIPVALNGKKMNGIELIMALNEIGGKHRIGRTDMMEDRVLGLKARENYEHPAATILITAHRDLEKLVLSRRELKFKRFVEEEWAELVYYGLVNDPLFHALNAFIDKTQERVTGWVKLKLGDGYVMPVARDSEYSLYDEELTSFDSIVVDQSLAEGFSMFHGLQGRVFYRVVKNRRN